MNYSFWTDEAYVSGIAKQLIIGQITFFDALRAPGIVYQGLQMLILSAFFKLFGASELTARLPSMIAFVFGVITIFFLAKKLSNIYGGLISAFLYAFSHLNLAYATQAKPYSLLETLTLLVIYLIIITKEIKQKYRIIANNFLIIALLIFSTLLHKIAIFLWILYGLYFCLNYEIFKKLNFKKIIFIVLTALIGLLYITPTIQALYSAGKIFSYNHSYQVIKLFLYKYSFITVSSFFGFVWLFKKNRIVSISLIVFSSVVLLMAAFEIYIFNIRYVLSLFGILFLFFGVFWSKVSEKYFPKKLWLIPLLVIMFLYLTGYKIVRLPQTYYNPNVDKYGDVQIANYKDFYEKLKDSFTDYRQLYVVNDTFDVEYWYFDRYSNAYFMKFTPGGSLSRFKETISAHPQGLLIMEDWQSILPDDIKLFAKKNLKLEFRVESLKEAPDDPWPLALYSWGLP